MKRTCVLLAVMAVSLSAWCQAPPNSSSSAPAAPPKEQVPPLAEYAGEWTAKFDGKIWLQLHLELHGDQLIGSLLRPHSLELNDNGELKSVSEEQVTQILTDAVINPDGLLLTVKDADTQKTDRYLMKVLPSAKDTADLKMIAMDVPPGIPKPRPWRLVKSGVATSNKAPDGR